MDWIGRAARLTPAMPANGNYTPDRGKCTIRGCRLLLLALSLLLLAGCQRGPTLPFLAPGARVLAFGDSLTFGTGARPGENYPAQLQVLIDRQVVNAGVPGETSAEGVRRLPRLLDELHPDLLILCHGGNDFLRRLNRGQAAANLRTMIESARSRGVPVVLVGVPPPALLLEAAPFFAELADEYHLPYLAEVLPEILGSRELKSDAVHPNAAGYRQLAEALARLLQASGAV